MKGNNLVVIPFGAGRRICVGMSLGLRMVQMLTATLVHSFHWALPNGLLPSKLNMDEASGLTLRRAQPLVAHPRPSISFSRRRLPTIRSRLPAIHFQFVRMNSHFQFGAGVLTGTPPRMYPFGEQKRLLHRRSCTVCNAPNPHIVGFSVSDVPSRL